MSTLAPRLPKAVEADPRGARLLERLDARTEPLWRESALRVPVVPLGPALKAALAHAYDAGHVVRGLESAERALAAEEHGLRLADRRSDAPRGARVSRLLLLADDGAERFYRQVESLLRRHAPRIMALRIEANAEALGELLFGSGRIARLVMLEHKDSVGAVLLALGESREPADASH